jgi:hypothetical protein
MDITRIRQLLAQGSSVVLVEEGQPPLVVTQLPERDEAPQEVPIASRWPKGRSIHEQDAAAASPMRPVDGAQGRQEQVLERLNKEILALREQITQEEAGGREEN